MEGEGDRDGDGILDAHDYDPDGHFYELDSGRIIPGGGIIVSGPGQVAVDPDGNSGYYDWTTDGTPGLYVMTVTPPEGYRLSPDCPAQPGPITPTGDAPIFLGSSEVAATASLADGSCAGNPYYLEFDIRDGAPFVFNNNIPLSLVEPTGIDDGDEPLPPNVTLDYGVFLPLVATQATFASADSGADGGDESGSVQEQGPVQEEDAGAVSEEQANEAPQPTPIPVPAVEETVPVLEEDAGAVSEEQANEAIEGPVNEAPQPTPIPVPVIEEAVPIDAAQNAALNKPGVGEQTDSAVTTPESTSTPSTPPDATAAQIGDVHRILLPFILN